MACGLTQGFTLDCKKQVGGIKAVYLMELANKGTIGQATGEITTWTQASGTQFWKYELREESSSFTENINLNNQAGTLFYEQVTTVQLDPLNQNRKTELDLVAQNDVLVIVQDSNGLYWLAGEDNGCYITAGTMQTGQAKGDLSGFTLTLTGKEKNPAREVDSTLIATLTTPA
jgi:hypothetical protein